MAAPPQPRMADDGDILVVIVLVGLAAFGLLLMQGGLAPLPWPPHSLKLRSLTAGVIGGLIGFAELVSRYRDEPWRTAATPPGLSFIAINAGAAVLALLLMEHFHAETHAPADGVARAMIAGTGAMVVLRSKLFTVRQPDGSEIAVGPALALDQVLAAVNRDIDRRRAARRHRLVSRCAEELAPYDIGEAVQFLRPALLAFQSLDQAERLALNASLVAIEKDDAIRAQNNEVKYKYFLFDLLTTSGEQTFSSLYLDLLAHLRRMPPSPPTG